MLNRKSGVLLHISSLFDEYSIGNFGKATKYFVDFLSDCGFTYWQILPFCPTDECNSPYKSPSAFSGNPYFIDLETLQKKDLLSTYELNKQKQNTPYLCEYERLHKERLPVLKTASTRINNKNEIKSFIESNHHLHQFCKFMAIKTTHKGEAWYNLKNELYSEENLFFWEFMQYEFFSEWRNVKQYANDKGIQIIGDMPLYVHLDSSDVWANKHLFRLDENNMPYTVAGVPPDYFSEEGQLWGNPIYNWDAMEKDNFTWWRNRISHMTKWFDGVRIDHFRGIESFWEVSRNAKNAKIGTMQKGPGMKLIHAISEECGDSLMIAEDLGIITEDVTRLVKESGFPSMRVFQFADTHDTSSPHFPHNYIHNCVAYTGTHDNNTLLGYLLELNEKNRKYMFSYCGHTGVDERNGLEAIIRTMMASHAGIVIFPIQDLLGFGSDTRMNTPGIASDNWAYRITKEQLDSIDKEKYRRWNEMYGRI